MSFDLLAPHYTWMERVLAGPRLQRARVMWLEALAGCERILINGVGHGHFLAACARRFPGAQITSVDASAGMLRRAKVQAARAGAAMDQLEFMHARFPQWAPPLNTYDAIVTHFFLDCFPPPELARVMQSLSAAAKPNASWLIADFAVPEHGWSRRRAKMVHALMYGFFRHVTKIQARRVTPPDPWLLEAGFSLRGRKTMEWGLLQSDLWSRRAAAL